MLPESREHGDRKTKTCIHLLNKNSELYILVLFRQCAVLWGFRDNAVPTTEEPIIIGWRQKDKYTDTIVL